MKEKEFNNIQDNKYEDHDFVIPNEAACSAEFSEGCIYCNED